MFENAKTERRVRDTKKSRFQIEKLEERIAPSHTRGHYRGPAYNHGSGGHCGHGACK